MESVMSISRRAVASKLRLANMQMSNPMPLDERIREFALCDGSGWIRRDNPRSLSECRCMKEARIRSLVPLRFQRANIADSSPAIFDLVERWRVEPNDGLLTAGKLGTGKTHLPAALIMELGRIKFSVQFWPAARVFRKIRETMLENRNESDILEKFRSLQILCLDDIGSGALTAFERRLLLEILEGRLNELQPTLVTTTWDLGTIANQMDDRIASRLSGFTRIELAGDDRRMRA